MEKYYRILKLRRGATQIEIRNAYRKLAKKLHPDVNSSPTAKEDFIEINEAYEFLTDPDVRRKVRFKATPRARRAARTAQHQQWNKEKRGKARKKANKYAQQKREEFLRQKAIMDRKLLPFQIFGLLFGLVIVVVIPFTSMIIWWGNSPPEKESENLSVVISSVIVFGIPIVSLIFYHIWHLIKFQVDGSKKK